MAHIQDAELRKTVEIYTRYGCNVRKTAKHLGIARSSLRGRLTRAEELGLMPKRRASAAVKDDLFYTSRIAQLERELNQIQRHNLVAEEVRRFVYRLGEVDPGVPDWVVEDVSRGGQHVNVGIPVAPLTDIHHNERVEPKEILGLNAFNIEICEERIRLWVERTIDLLTKHLVGEYPGMVIPFLGDFISGLIHEELTATNEEALLVALQRLFGILKWALTQFANTFKRLFIPCVPGNHGRLKPGKPWVKSYAANNFDWHLYCLLESFFENDDRIRFNVSHSQDVQWMVYGWRYRGTHGAQFRGGDGIIGPIGPIFRGDVRKRAIANDAMRDSQIDIGYDTLVLGHFHTTILSRRLMVCGSIKGFDEFSFQANLPYEPPQLALWLHHPERGPTLFMPIQCDEGGKKPRGKAWVAWQV